MFLVEKQIASAREQFLKRDACQVRPMVRRPSVPVEYLCIFLVIIEHLFFHFALPSLHTLSCLLVFAPALQQRLTDMSSVFVLLFARLRQPSCLLPIDGFA